MNLDDLRKPFPPEAISWRVGSATKDKTKGLALAFLDARDVMNRLDEVCGVGGWQCRYVPMHDKKTVCEIGIRIGWDSEEKSGEWVWKSDGAGDSDIEAEKGALSAAFKRAAVRFGIGRYLYDLDSPWVELDTYEKNGQTFAKGIKQGEFAKLRALLAKDGKPPSSPPPSPAAAKPDPAPQDRAQKAREWALGQIPKIKTMDRSTLDAFTNKFRQQIIDLKELDSKASVELDKAVADRIEALFA